MSFDQNDTESGLSTVVPDKRRFLQSVGVVLTLLGILAVLVPFLTDLTLSIMLGVAAIIGGILHFIHAFSAEGWPGSLVQVVLAVVYTVTGMVLMANPELAIAPVLYILVAFFVLEGLASILLAFTVRKEEHWEWCVFSGLLSLLFGALLWSGLPSTADWGLALLFGLTLATSGVSLVLLGRPTETRQEEVSETAA